MVSQVLHELSRSQVRQLLVHLLGEVCQSMIQSVALSEVILCEENGKIDVVKISPLKILAHLSCFFSTLNLVHFKQLCKSNEEGSELGELIIKSLFVIIDGSVPGFAVLRVETEHEIVIVPCHVDWERIDIVQKSLASQLLLPLLEVWLPFVINGLDERRNSIGLLPFVEVVVAREWRVDSKKLCLRTQNGLLVESALDPDLRNIERPVQKLVCFKNISVSKFGSDQELLSLS